MAIDGIYLYSLVEDLKKSILNSKIDKINHPFFSIKDRKSVV